MMLLRKNLFMYLLPMVFVVGMTACEEDDTSPDHGLNADAGEDRSVALGQTVQLDASETTDALDEGFQSSWSFAEVPEGSEAAIENANNHEASFVPDVVGDFIVTLMVSNEHGEDSDQVIITAIDAETEELSGNYNEDLHLTKLVDEPGMPDYLVTGDVDIRANLTIDPGVIIHLMSDRRFRIRGDGVIQANGTADQPIVFTGESELPGYWRGILHESNNLENKMEHVIINSAGSSNISSGRPQTGMHVGSGRITLEHVSFADNDGFGLSVRGSDSQTPMNACEFSGNTSGAMHVYPSNVHYIDSETEFNGGEIRINSGNLDEGSDHTWVNPLNGHYYVNGDVDSRGHLEIEAGAEFQFGSDVRFRMRGQSVIQAMGTKQSPIIFKGAVEQAGAWRGVFIEGSSLENQLNHVHFAHAGQSNISSGYGKAALTIANGARSELNNLHFSDVEGYGLYLRSNSGRFSANSLSFGNGLTEGSMHILSYHIDAIDAASDFGNNYIVIDGGSVEDSEDQFWPNPQNGIYLYKDDNDIYGKVTIEEGTVFEFENDVRFRVRSEGILIAEGTPSEMIVFTRKQGSGAHWRGLLVDGTSPENMIDYAEISYAGNSSLASGFGQTNIGVGNNGRLTITNSTISNSMGFGIDVRSNGELTESDNTFTGNADDDINYQ